MLPSPPSSLAGSVWYLPHTTEVRIPIARSDLPPPDAFDHPVLVLSRGVTDGKVSILIITSFGKRGLADRHGNNWLCRSYYLPIDPSERHPDSGILLSLEGGVALKKASYINVKTVHQVPLSMLRGLREAAKASLTHQSYDEVRRTMARFGSWVDNSVPARGTTSLRSMHHKLHGGSYLRGSLPGSQNGVTRHLNYGTSVGHRQESRTLPFFQPPQSPISGQRGQSLAAQRRQRTPASWLRFHRCSWLPTLSTTLYFIRFLLLAASVGALVYGVYSACLAVLASIAAFGEWLGQRPGEISKLIRDWFESNMRLRI